MFHMIILGNDISVYTQDIINNGLDYSFMLIGGDIHLSIIMAVIDQTVRDEYVIFGRTAAEIYYIRQLKASSAAQPKLICNWSIGTPCP